MYETPNSKITSVLLLDMNTFLLLTDRQLSLGSPVFFKRDIFIIVEACVSVAEIRSQSCCSSRMGSPSPRACLSSRNAVPSSEIQANAMSAP